MRLTWTRVKTQRKTVKDRAAGPTINLEIGTLKAILKYTAKAVSRPEELRKVARMFPSAHYKGKRILRVGELGRLVEYCFSHFAPTSR